MPDPHDLQRFLDAQEPIYGQARTELRSGRKLSHWMWFMFPQLAGLGHSPTARRYAIRSRAEALAYLQHPILGERLLELTGIVNRLDGRTLREIFGAPDDLKFCSSMTLFASVGPERAELRAALDKYCGGHGDARTRALLGP